MMKPTHLILNPNKGYIGIGENHSGLYCFDFNNTKHLYGLLKTVKQKTVTLWYEGPTQAAISKSFTNFKKDLESFIFQDKVPILIKVNGWELDLPMASKEVEHPSIILGPDISQIKTFLSPYLNKNMTLVEAIAKSRKFYDRNPPISSEGEVVKALSESGGKPSKILDLMLEPNSCNSQTIEKIWGGGYSALRAPYFEGTPGAYLSSTIYQNVRKFNSRRDDHLANKMKQKGGIFLAGDGHIQILIQKYSM